VADSANPSIERTATGKPMSADHRERYALKIKTQNGGRS